jgi:hypothetical protein
MEVVVIVPMGLLSFLYLVCSWCSVPDDWPSLDVPSGWILSRFRQDWIRKRLIERFPIARLSLSIFISFLDFGQFSLKKNHRLLLVQGVVGTWIVVSMLTVSPFASNFKISFS